LETSSLDIPEFSQKAKLRFNPFEVYITFSIRQMLYAMDLKKNKIYSLGLQAFGGSLYP
jgi:hypothetical protein